MCVSDLKSWCLWVKDVVCAVSSKTRAIIFFLFSVGIGLQKQIKLKKELSVHQIN